MQSNCSVDQTSKRTPLYRVGAETRSPAHVWVIHFLPQDAEQTHSIKFVIKKQNIASG